MNGELTRFLASTELLKGLSSMDLARIMDHIELISIHSGDRLIQQGDPGDCLYILQHGKLEICLADDEGNEVVLGKVEPGKSVGEIALLTGERRSASVFASSDATVLRFHQSDFKRLREKAPNISEQFTDIIVNRLQQAELQNLLHTSDQFNGMDKDALSNLETELELIHCSSGQYLIHEGDDSDCIYIIVSGRLQVFDQYGEEGERILLELGRGQTVGEMAIISGGKRSASVRATRDSLMAKLSQEGFNRLLQAHPQAITRQFAGKIIDRLWLQTFGKDRNKSNVANIAVVPTNQAVSLTEFCAKLCRALSSHGPTLHLKRSDTQYYVCASSNFR